MLYRLTTFILKNKKQGSPRVFKSYPSCLQVLWNGIWGPLHFSYPLPSKLNICIYAICSQQFAGYVLALSHLFLTVNVSQFQWLAINGYCSSAVSAVPGLVNVHKLDFVAEKTFLLFSRALGHVVEFIILSEQINQKRARPV